MKFTMYKEIAFVTYPSWVAKFIQPLLTMMTSSNGIFFPRYWPCVRGIQRSPVDSPHKGQWRGPLLFSLIYTWTNNWTNTGDLRRHRAHYDVIMIFTHIRVTVIMSCAPLIWNFVTAEETIRNYPAKSNTYLKSFLVDSKLWVIQHMNKYLIGKFVSNLYMWNSLAISC